MAFGSAIISSEVIAGRFAELKARGRRALIPYVTAGHPTRADSLELLRGLASAGPTFWRSAFRFPIRWPTGR